MFRMYAAAAAMFTAFALASPAAAQSFTAIPTSADFEREYPPAALDGGISGNVEIACRVNAEGELTRCQVESESPPGLGFGDAGLRMAQYFRVIPPAPQMGRSRSSPRITIPLIFETAAPGTTPADPTAPPVAEQEERPNVVEDGRGM